MLTDRAFFVISVALYVVIGVLMLTPPVLLAVGTCGCAWMVYWLPLWAREKADELVWIL